MKSNRNAIIILVLIALVAVAVSGCTSKNNSTSVNESSTKVAFLNNGSTWFHVDLVVENMTMKNGTVQNFYGEAYIKPGGNVTIDLSGLGGYGNQPLPAGTNIRIMGWKGLYNQTIVSNTSDMDLNMQGWSKTLYPQSGDQKYNVTIQNLPVNQLPANITDNTLVGLSTDITQFENDPDDNSSTDPIFEEEVLSVDANGKVTMVFVTPPTLCDIAAHPI
jgi:hypothetical protein